MIRTIVVDNEPLAIQLVEGYVKKTPFLELVASFDDSLEALRFLESQTVDLVLLDIQMPDLTGIELAKIMQGRPKIIFTTAYEHYAIQGFKLDAVDYLLKPFSFEEFYQAASKAQKSLQLEQKALSNPIEVNQGFLFIKSEYKIRRIGFADILFLEGLKDYVKIYLQGEPNPVLSLTSLRILEQKLPPEQFMRVHRSFIVNLNRIALIDRSRIVFGNHYIPIGDAYKEKFQEFIDRNFL